MKAVVVRGVGEVALENVEGARIEAPTDALLRVTSTAIYGTDLHIYEGRMGDVAGMVIGHEPLGVVAQVTPGDSVAIFGAGAIGLLATYSALHLRGASEVYVVDDIPARLEKAGEIGAVPIDFRQGDPAEQIMERRSWARGAGGAAWRGEEAMNGEDGGIDAIGFQARAFAHPGREDPEGGIPPLA